MTLQILSRQLASRGISLTRQELRCLGDERRLQEAVAVLSQLRDRHGITIPIPSGHDLAHADCAEEAIRLAREHERRYVVITVDGPRIGPRFRATGFNGLEAAFALAAPSRPQTYCIAGCWFRAPPRPR